MNTRIVYRSLGTVAVTALLLGSAYAVLAHSGKTSTDQPVAQASALDKDIMKLSQNGFQAERAIHGARIAIFEGDPTRAKQLLTKAYTLLAAAVKEAPVVDVDIKTGVKGKVIDNTTLSEKVDVIPIDGQLVLADSFVDKPEKKKHIDKANEHFAKGRSQQAIDELKLAEVDASFTRVLMPLEATKKHIDEATKLIAQNKYYEANLALKAAEDGLRVDSVVLSEAPKAAATTAKPAK